jgi:hypothetical protein
MDGIINELLWVAFVGWMVGWLDGWMDGLLLEKSVENLLRCDWSMRISLVILLASYWTE